MVTLFNENREDFFLLLNSPLEAPGGGRPGRGPGGEQMIQVSYPAFITTFLSK